MGSSACKPVHVGGQIKDCNANKINITKEESVLSKPYEKKPKTNAEQEKAETSKPKGSEVLELRSRLKKTVSFENFPIPNRQKEHVKLKNFTNKTYFSNTQYNQSIEGVSCSGLRCKGSIVNASARDYGVLKTRNELIKEARAFIDSYFTSIEKFNSHEHSERWAEISKSINWTGTYQLKYNELCFGCKLAWRNAPRCIGRIQWNILQVFDARNAKTCSDMFDAICRHIRYCTNKGKIRSGITVFPHMTGKDEYFRIWNPQFIRYAGYQRPDGTIIGDPVSVEFTEVCQKLGWKGKGTMFDVLPLLLQINGKDPEVFEIPEDIVLEVTLKHPRFPWFEQLGLKWYGLPAVSNLIFECGGLIFTAAPFSGWYMSTEIGARNLCDSHRYNISEIVANKMGLDTESPTTLWKDKAILEVNIAVLYSFQQEGVTITDHHSASESFMKFMTDENRLRGGCPADWVWIVPPISGSATPVFHQEMLMYKLKPGFEYVQGDPWSSHCWKSNKLKTIFEKTKVSFKTLCWLAMTVAILMRALALKRVNCTILYATVTGNALRYTRTLERMFKNAFNVQVKCMDEYSLKDMENDKFVLIVTSTFGNGDAPESAMQFAKEIRMATAKKRSIISKESRSSIFSLQNIIEEESDKTKNISLKNVRHSVFGLGSRAYPFFCGFAHFLDTSLRILGADNLHPIGEGDELNGQETSFAIWAKGVFKECVQTYRITDEECIKRAMKQIEHADTSWAPHKFLLMPTEVKPENLMNSLSSMHSTNISSCTVKGKTQLQSSESSRQTLLIEMVIDNNDGLLYEPGDHIGIYPANNKQDVSYIINRFDESVIVDEPIKVVRYVRKASTAAVVNVLAPVTNIPVCTIKTALVNFLDINSPPTQTLLGEMADFATEKDDEKKLLDLAEDPDLYKKWRNEKYPSFADVLKEFPSIQVYPEFLLTQFPVLKERFYSISSSSHVHPGEVHLTVGIVKYKKNDDHEYEGVCSSWFNRLEIGETVPCRILATPVFHLPENRSLPVILIGAGTGIAPFRSFWQQRKYDIDMGVDEEFGDMYLFFGCRDPNIDDIYQKELREAEKEGVITKVFHAYSREKGKRKVYVQDLLQKNNQLITSEILKKDGHIYVCGETNMAKDISSALIEIIRRTFIISSLKAANIVQGLRDSDRYHEELFGPSVMRKN